MRFVRYCRPGGDVKPGLLQHDQVLELRSIFPAIPDIGPEFFAEDWPARLRHVSGPTLSLADVRLACPLAQTSKIICLGKNYAEHAREGGFEAPVRPLLFCKTPNTLNGPCDDILLPRSSSQVDWEVELAVVIGKTGKCLARQTALDWIAGVTIMNDVSARAAQFGDTQWFRGKSFDTFAPLGPAIVTLDEIENLHALRLTAEVDGVVMQDGNTRDLIFDIPGLLEYISEDITLQPGDVISTGTPAGVGIFRDPPIVLQPGNIVTCRIEGLGTLRNRCIA